MNKESLQNLMEKVRQGQISNDEAVKILSELPYKDLGFAKIDHHREIRTGYPEIIFGEGKSAEQMKGIISHLLTKENDILATRVEPGIFNEIKEVFPEAEYNETARCISIKRTERAITDTTIGVITAGTSDLPVAEEAAVTAEVFGNRVSRIFDVGVAGIHRLFDNLDEIKEAKVLVVVAGMEGALPSIVGGLVESPVIAVPTSVGYGANFGGLSALLGMLTSCAAGVSVVNIDNGFGAAYQASMINNL